LLILLNNLVNLLDHAYFLGDDLFQLIDLLRLPSMHNLTAQSLACYGILNHVLF